MTDDRLPDNRHLNRQACPVVASPVGSRLWRQTASFSSLAARKATFLLALILIGSPVAGLRPMRAARLRTCRMPRPLMRMRSPFLRCFTRRSTRSLRIVSACFFGTSWVSARDAARCLRVTVVGVAAFAMVGKLPVLALSYFEETPNHARRIDTRFVAAGHAKNALFIEETCRQQRFRRCLLHWALRRQDGDLRRFCGHF